MEVNVKSLWRQENMIVVLLQIAHFGQAQVFLPVKSDTPHWGPVHTLVLIEEDALWIELFINEVMVFAGGARDVVRNYPEEAAAPLATPWGRHCWSQASMW